MPGRRRDPFTPAERSRVMAAVRGKGNKSTELKLRALFRAAGITGWRRHAALPGKPDFVFRGARLAIFVDGCFWHGCPRCYRRPSASRKYWDAKVNRNKARDRMVRRELRARGWRVMRIWEHQLKSGGENIVNRIRHALEHP